MKNKIFFKLIIFTIFFQQASFAQNRYYTIEQIKDTLTKYDSAFEAFDKFKMYKIPIGKFREDSFLLKKSLELFDVKHFRKYVFLRNTAEELRQLEELESVRKSKIERYLKNVKKIPIKKLDYYYDSIAQNKTLLKKYIDTVYFIKRKSDSIGYSKYRWKTTPNKYITFHSKLMTQTGYDTIRAYYDRYYQKFNEDKYFGGKVYNSVIIALLYMGDPEINAKYDIWFDKKFKKDEIRLYEYLFLKNNVKGSLQYRKLAKLLFCDYFVVFDSEGAGYQINGYVAHWNFPFIDTLSFDENIKIRDAMVGKNYAHYDKKTGKVFYKPKSSYQEFYQYYMNYVAYLEKKEKPLFDKIKYKNDK